MSLDFTMISRMIVDGLTSKTKKEDKEKFEGSSQPILSVADQHIGKTELFMLNTLMFSVSILLSIVAFWLSWTCNTALGYNTVLKAVFGAMAFFFGLTYILLFFVMRWDVCRKKL